MKNFLCTCGATIYFENSRCLHCDSDLGWCPGCNTMTTLVVDAQGQLRCGDSNCQVALSKCYNYAVEAVCNRCLLSGAAEAQGRSLCEYCRFNDTIPDLSVDDNREKWHRIEMAKRRLLYSLDLLGVPYGDASDGFEPPLSFDFKGDGSSKQRLWFTMNQEEQVYTGHSNGKVTINIREADDVEREKARVSFGEAHRTVIGHFRHEMGHYFWDALVKGRREEECIAVFGDHNNPDYGTALQRYYDQGPGQDWQEQYISAYATMHPWEDFAECFAAYLDMVSVLDTAFHAGNFEALDPVLADFADMSRQYTQLGLFVNELNRAVGLLDLVPEVHTPFILNKIEFVHDLLRDSRQGVLRATA